jgi:hypothetical protein
VTTSVLGEATYPIVGWAGPGDSMIRPDVMAGMAQAGFTVSHSWVHGELVDVLGALDVAAEAGIRLLLCHPSIHVGDKDVFSDARLAKVDELVSAIRDHPGLYGYHLRDEPRFDQLPKLARVHAFIAERDPYHLSYINHFPPIEGWGAPTAEAFWRQYIELVHPKMLSYDHYPITVAPRADIAAQTGRPNVFAEAGLIIKPDFFSCLELLRGLSAGSGLPFWAFTCSVRHGPYPTPTEGHMRWQLMNDLAYGARGLQYFTYAHDHAMVRPDGTKTETWEMARRINTDIHAMAPSLQSLHNVGVFRTGPLWAGTQPLHQSHVAPWLSCEGDPVTIGIFQNDHDILHLMVVNGSPVDWASIRLRVEVVPEQRLLVFDLNSGAFRELWPADPSNQLVTLAPGEGRLFKVDREGLRVNF